MKRILTPILIVLILFLAFLPHLLSTTPGKNFLLWVINHSIEGKVLSVEKLSLRWFGVQKVEGIKLVDHENKELFIADCVERRGSIFSCGEWTLENPSINYVVHVKESKKKKKKKKWDFCGALCIKGGRAQLQNETQKVVLSDIQVEFNQKQSYLKLSANTEMGGSKGELCATGNLGRALHLSIISNHLPTAIFDILNENVILSSALGNEINFNGDLNRQEEKYHLEATIETQNLKGKILGTTREDYFVVDPNSQIDFTLTPHFFDTVFDSEGWSLANRPKIRITVCEWIIPLKKKKLHLSDLWIDATLEMEKSEISHEHLGNFSLNDFHLNVNTKEKKEITYLGIIQSKGGPTAITGEIDFLGEGKYTFCGEAKKFPTVLLEMLFKKNKNLPELIGPDIDLIFDGTKNESFDLNYQVVSSKVKGEGKIIGSDLEDLKMTAKGDFILPSKVVCYLGDSLHFDFSLQEDDLQGNLNNPHLNAEIKGKLGFDLDEIELGVKGSIKDLPLIRGQEFKSGLFDLKIDGPKSLILGKADFGEGSGPELHANLQIEDFISENAINLSCGRWLVEGNAYRFPTEVIGHLLESELPLCDLFGNLLHLHFDACYFDDHAEVDLEAKGEGFQTDLSFCLNDSFHVSQTKPSCVHWDITPQRYQSLLQIFEIGEQSRFTLHQNASLDLQIKELTCPIPSPPSLASFLCQSGFMGDVKLEGLLLKDLKSKDWLSIPQIEGVLTGQDFSKSIHLNLKGNIAAGSIPQGRKGEFLFQGEILDAFLESGRINRERMKMIGEISFDYVPVKEMLCASPIREELSTKIFALLGPLVNGRIYGEISALSGPLTIDIKSTNLKALLPLQLQDKAVFLKQAVEAELTLTPEVSETFLKDINPLFITGAWSDHPVKLYIDAGGFRVQLIPFSIQTTNIDRAVIDLGRIHVRNGGQLTSLMNFLKARDISPDGVMEAWFTPIYVNLHQGVASYSRFDLLLAGQVHLAFWGSIDLISEQVNMTLAISEQTLNQRFNISGIKKTDMFQVKMTGSTSHPQLDWSGASTRIGILIAKSAGGGLGKIVGGLLEQIVKTMGEEPTPPPTAYPFPWEQFYPQADRNNYINPPFLEKIVKNY